MKLGWTSNTISTPACAQIFTTSSASSTRLTITPATSPGSVIRERLRFVRMRHDMPLEGECQIKDNKAEEQSPAHFDNAAYIPHLSYLHEFSVFLFFLLVVFTTT